MKRNHVAQALACLCWLGWTVPLPAQTYVRTVGLLVTEVPERPAGAILFTIEVPPLYALESTPNMPNVTLAQAMELQVLPLANGGTLIQGLATPASPMQLHGYIVTFCLLMPDPCAVPVAVQLRAFRVWLDNGWPSRNVDAELLIEEGPDGQGELP